MDEVKEVNDGKLADVESLEEASNHKTSKAKKFFKPLIGTGICSMSALFYSSSSVLVKQLSHVDPIMLSAVRFFVIAMFAIPIAIKKVDFKDENLTPSKWWLMFWRSILGASEIMIYYYAVQVSTN